MISLCACLSLRGKGPFQNISGIPVLCFACLHFTTSALLSPCSKGGNVSLEKSTHLLGVRNKWWRNDEHQALLALSIPHCFQMADFQLVWELHAHARACVVCVHVCTYACKWEREGCGTRKSGRKGPGEKRETGHKVLGVTWVSPVGAAPQYGKCKYRCTQTYIIFAFFPYVYIFMQVLKQTFDHVHTIYKVL